jgi:hypothetical protein
MHGHVSKFYHDRAQYSDKRRFDCVCMGVCISIVLFLISHILKDYVAIYESESDIRLAHILASGEREGGRWDFYPNIPKDEKPKFGIVMGGTSNMFDDESHTNELKLPMFSTCINKLYAMKNQYAFKLVRNLEDVNNRTYGPCATSSMTPWNKIVVVKEYLPDVEHLIWIDLDAVIVRTHIQIDSILNASNKMDTDLGQWFGTQKFSKHIHRHRVNLTGSVPDPFLWASQDINPDYWVNLNSAVFVIKNVPMAFDFLSDVWAVGDDPDCFKRHDHGWKKKVMCEGVQSTVLFLCVNHSHTISLFFAHDFALLIMLGYYGWPWEQGGESKEQIYYISFSIILRLLCALVVSYLDVCPNILNEHARFLSLFVCCF